ncbi:hypothetical protein C8Q73DRAFT_794324 [Cubamyces lactineus]|nr:hypothetical protein C8Q73DRAFT_794324 [Cubamyces lactineus]
MAVRTLFAPIIIAGLLAHIAGVAAAAGAAGPDPPACATKCLAQAVSSGSTGCTSATDVQCLCSDPSALSAIGSCINGQCPKEDQQAAIEFFLAQCQPFLPLSTTDSTGASETSSGATTIHGTTSVSITASASSGTQTSSDSHAHGSSSSSGTSKGAASATASTDTATATGASTSARPTTTLVVQPSSGSDTGPVTTLGVSATGDAAAATDAATDSATAGGGANGTETVPSGSIVPTGTGAASNKTSGAIALGVQPAGPTPDNNDNNFTESSVALTSLMSTSSTTAPPTDATDATSTPKQPQAPVAAVAATFSKTTLIALAASLGGSASCAIVLLGLCWRRRMQTKRHNVVPTDPRLRVSVFPDGPREGHCDEALGREYGDAFRDSDGPEREQGGLSRAGRPVARVGLGLGGGATGTGMHDDCKLGLRASTSPARSAALDRATAIVATQGEAEPPADRTGAAAGGIRRDLGWSWMRGVVAADEAQALASSGEVQSGSSEYTGTAPTYTSEEPILPWTRDAPSRRLQWGEGVARSEAGASDSEPPPPYVPVYEPR